MACFYPNKAYHTLCGQITFDQKQATLKHQTLSLPCGQCIGCRLEYSRQWAIRIMDESSLHTHNCFITLTYDNENLPEHQSLNKRHFQLFIKRLRKYYKNRKIRYFHCGEYGDELGRPHYHAILFNLDFYDKTKLNYKSELFHSQILENLWGKGYVTIGPVNFETAAYVSRYVIKKINGKQKLEHYARCDQITGEIIQLQQEYATMSRRPGIGGKWYNKYKTDIYPSDYITINGFKQRPAKFYDLKYKHESPELHAQLVENRLKRHDKSNNTKQRLLVREEVLKSKLSIKQRPL